MHPGLCLSQRVRVVFFVIFVLFVRDLNRSAAKGGFTKSTKTTKKTTAKLFLFLYSRSVFQGLNAF